jgi:hypothetical protein
MLSATCYRTGYKIISTLLIPLLLVLVRNEHCTAQSLAAIEYLNELTNILETHSVYKHKIDWHQFRKDLLLRSRGCVSTGDCYPIVRYALKKLRDKHSYFSGPPAADESMKEQDPPVYPDESVPNNIGYVRVPYCMGDEIQNAQFISTITSKIRARNQTRPTGWIIDLRGNFGGNMWPMMAGLAPLLAEGIQGYFREPGGRFIPWRLNNGAAAIDTQILAVNNEFRPTASAKRIAVLIDNRTASSGEAIAVLFKGMANTRFFGSPTYGVSTGCETFILSDGSRLNLATTIFADRNKNTYGGAILPDIYCSDSDAVTRAIAWLIPGR